jgi:hypothetical protein
VEAQAHESESAATAAQIDRALERFLARFARTMLALTES